MFSNRLKEVQQYVADNDTSLAFRRLLDCALETQDLALFKRVLEFCDNKEALEHQPGQLQSAMLELLGQMQSARINEVAPNAILEVEDISKSYLSGNFELQPVRFALAAREIMGLVGENGNGKTTLLRLLSADLKPDRGQIHYRLNQGIHTYNSGSSSFNLRTQLIYIEQRIPKWYGSLMDNLQFTLSNYGVKGEANYLWVQMMIERMGLRPYKHLNWNSISSGYRTRFEIAKTLLRKPQVLLLDEPLANLDIMAQQTLLQDLKFMASSLSAPFGMILSSQHIYEVEKVSDKIVFLRNGAPRYQDNTKLNAGAISIERADTEKSRLIGQSESIQHIIIELETSIDRNELQQALKRLKLEKITFNGGVYVLYFNLEHSISDVLEALAYNKVPLSYLRDITHSSRRFFNS